MATRLDAVYSSHLRQALSRSAFTERVIERIGQTSEYAREFHRSLGGGGEDGDDGKISWRTREDKERQERYDRYQKLYHNKSEQYLRPEWLPSGKLLYTRINMLRFVTNTYADLMCGSGAEVKTNNKTLDDHLNNEVEIKNHFLKWQQLVSINGLIGLQVVADDRGVDIIHVSPDLLYPEFEDGSDDDFKWVSKKHYVKVLDVKDPSGRWEFNGDKQADKDDGIVFEERHFRGSIKYYLYTVKGDEITSMLPPSWYNESLPPLDENGECCVQTGIDEFMLIVVPNMILAREFVSDFDDIIDFQANINVRASQINRVLNVHADPKLMLGESFRAKDPYTGEPIIRGLRDEVLIVANEDHEFRPEYLTWQSQLESAFREIEQNINMLCTVAQISPSLIVRQESIFPEAATAFKLRLTPTLSKVRRKAQDFKSALQRVIWVYANKAFQHGLLDVPTPPEGDPFKTTTQDGTNKHGQPEPAEEVPLSVDANDPKVAISRVLTGAPNQIEIRFIPNLPQDERLLIDRLTSNPPSVSLDRILKEVDQMSPDEIEEEKQRIQDTASMQAESVQHSGGFPFGGGGGVLDEADALEKAINPSATAPTGMGIGGQ